MSNSENSITKMPWAQSAARKKRRTKSNWLYEELANKAPPVPAYKDRLLKPQGYPYYYLFGIWLPRGSKTITRGGEIM